MVMIPYSVPEINFKGWREFLTSFFWDDWQEETAVKNFEQELASYVGTHHAVSFSSARYCLYLVYRFFGCRGKKVIAPAYTCIPAIDAIRWAGATPEFVDISLTTYNPIFSPHLNRVQNIGAISLSYLYGLVDNPIPLIQFAKKRGIPVIEDAAIALGARIRDKRVGSLGETGVFSLQSSKLITAWRGGVITTNNQDLYTFLKHHQARQVLPSRTTVFFNGLITGLRKVLSNQMIYGYVLYPLNQIVRQPVASRFLSRLLNQDPSEAIRGESPKKLPQWETYRFTSAQARLALASFRHFDQIFKKRQVIAQSYLRNLREINGLVLPQSKSKLVHAYGRFPIRIEGLNKYKAQSLFATLGVEVGLNYPYIIPQTKYFKGSYTGSFPNALKASQETILLPMHTQLNQADLSRITSAVRSVVKHHRFYSKN
ncbi:hypothetical protein A3A66_00800 [Microgenomates group bacterium RIFCSPLOWO2_01_FULL_46_13]|nr:MAG: hypothetical protein A2783_02880 [Microgenomates group bacterium RIFCSPHIGHO2_01_FULL_45_11]OGV94546.1 MAG: hypothetical protein A3A66_00800 [Microgenomates group bacterium RIFCSPLOWO2_01_FULL_46_13]